MIQRVNQLTNKVYCSYMKRVNKMKRAHRQGCDELGDTHRGKGVKLKVLVGNIQTKGAGGQQISIFFLRLSP